MVGFDLTRNLLFSATAGQQHVATGPAAEGHDRAGQATDPAVQRRGRATGQKPDGEGKARGG